MLRTLRCFFFISIFFSLQSKSQGKEPVYRYRVIKTANNSFGYDILKGEKVFIHQPVQPAVEGNKGFRNKQDAAKVARLVLYKLKNNIFPPAVTRQELDSLQIK
jgi:hypothetical protein